MPAPASAPGWGRATLTPRGRADEGSCVGWGENGRPGTAFRTRWLQFRMGETETNPEAASCFTWKPGPLAWPDQGPKGIFSLESWPERMEPEESDLEDVLPMSLASVWPLPS